MLYSCMKVSKAHALHCSSIAIRKCRNAQIGNDRSRILKKRSSLVWVGPTWATLSIELEASKSSSSNQHTRGYFGVSRFTSLIKHAPDMPHMQHVLRWLWL